VVHRSYDQYCPIAAALDVLGDRWTLLILRELTMGERRFTDLRTALPGIAPNLLADRLRDLQAEGLVEQRELPPPAARTVYAATQAGLEVVPVLRSLARFGAERLGPPAEDVAVLPRMAVYAMVSPYHAPEPVGERFHARLLVDGATFDVLTDGPRVSLRRRPDATPDVEIEVSARDLVAARQGRASPLPSTPEAQRFARLFQLA
jgi:DNA-binding HxlR family transcriptional regulator